MSDGVVVSQEQMFRLLMKIDSSLSQLINTVDTIDDRVADHEARLRSIEQREDLSRRVAEMETTLQSVQQRVWAFPSLAGVAAVIAILVAISDRF
jgi:Tfp pilus assembly protein PilN